MARRRRIGRRRRRRGMGSIITVRRGLGQARGGLMEHALPPLVGGGVTALVALAIRWFVDPAAGATQRHMVKWAPLLGLGSGMVASMAMYMMGGGSKAARTSAGTVSMASAVAVGAFALAQDFVMKEKGGSVVAAIASNGAAMAAMAPAANANAGAAGFGAIVPEYSRPALGNGTGAIVMEPVGRSGQRAGTIGSYGETVSLSGVNTSAFGTPGFSA